MFKAIREFHREISARADRKNWPRDESGRAVIKMAVHDKSAFLSPYSHGAGEVINDEAAEFIRNSALGHTPKEQFSLHIYSDCINETEQEVYKNAIHEYFNRHFSDNAREMFINTLQSVVMFGIGLIGLMFMILAQQLGWGEIWVECIDIFAWVFLWETVDLFFLERATLRRKARRFLAFAKMEVNFYSLSTLNAD